MRTSVAAATVAASVLAGGAFGALLGAPGPASAREAGAAAASWIDDALAGLVEDGTITQPQSDAVEAALEEARPEHHGRRHLRVGRHLDVAAEALGLTPEELRAQLEDGSTLADVAGEQGVEVSALVDALVAERTARLAAAVADGRLTQEQADAREAELEEWVTAMVEGELPEPPARPFGPRGDRPRTPSGTGA